MHVYKIAEKFMQQLLSPACTHVSGSGPESDLKHYSLIVAAQYKGINVSFRSGSFL